MPSAAMSAAASVHAAATKAVAAAKAVSTAKAAAAKATLSPRGRASLNSTLTKTAEGARASTRVRTRLPEATQILVILQTALMILRAA